MSEKKLSVDIIVPVYNEEYQQVESVVEKIWNTLNAEYNLCIFVVNDGSNENFNLDRLAGNEKTVYLKHEENKGYGSALKTGIKAGNASWIGIVDADATYPVDQFPRLLKDMENADMVIGTRTSETRHVPWLRRFPKYCLNRFASYMAGREVVDLNSGMRVFDREICEELWGFFPKRFSFTSTLTMGGYLNDFRIKEVSIDYFKRQGKSSIRPIHDTVHFANIILRMGLLFHPLKIFIPIACCLFLIGISKGLLIDYMSLGHVGNLAVFFMLSALQVLLMGYIADLIVRSRYVRYKKQ